MAFDLAKVRNIGISAHIDSGKTTLSERILFYTDRIHAIHEVRGKDGVGAKMDSMDLEREKGITIQSAATYCDWKGFHVNLIDTPGHVDFTIEVERSLRVLDGAILVLCGVAGVQSQSFTVDRQMRRYGVPRIAFVNKLDRAGANAYNVAKQIREKLSLNAVHIQIPIGAEDKLEGIIDLVQMKAAYFEGEDGRDIRWAEIPAAYQAQATEYRDMMLDAVSLYSDDLMEQLLEGAVAVNDKTIAMVRNAIRLGTIANKLVPVCCGSAYRNKGVQLLLDAVTYYLPNPTEKENLAINKETGEKFPVKLDTKEPLIMLAFKLVEDKYGQLTYIRIYQGQLKKGEMIYNQRTQQRVKVGRIVRMHSSEMEDIGGAEAGDICALFGVECASGDTFTDGRVEASMESMFVPEPVIKMAIKPKDSKGSTNLGKALNRFTKEDPTFRSFLDKESNETIIAGMGELHLEVYIERMKREYGVEVEAGKPQVAYRETIQQRADFNYLHKKQTGGSGQFGRVVGYIEPALESDFEFDWKVVGGNIPTEFSSSVEKGFKASIVKGRLIGFPVVNFRAVVTDGASHAVDSSDNAFQAAGRGAFRQAYPAAKPVILEPIMKLSVEGPQEFAGAINRTINQRRGMIIDQPPADGGYTRVDAEVPLSEMFGYSTVLRSATQGKAEFSMEFAKYAPVPPDVAKALREEYGSKIVVEDDE